MSLIHRPSPALVTQAAARAFPRWALFALLASYALAGLFGRDVWVTGDDAASFGAMWTMAHGNPTDWLLPNIAGELVPQDGPLPFWVGAAFVLAFGPWLGDATAARLTAVFWIGLTTASLWYATYRLARREEAQPVAFAFGGEAGPRDYGRMLGDIAVLLLIGTVGLAPRIRDLGTEPAALGCTALAIYGAAWAIDRPRRGALLAGLAAGALALSSGPLPGLLLLVALGFSLFLYAPPQYRGWAIALAAATAIASFAAWPLAATALAPAAERAAYFIQWGQWVLAGIGAPRASDFGWLLRTGAWFLWPLWPLAGWTLYAWRHGLRAAHVAIPAATLLALSFAFLIAPTGDQSALMLLVPPLVVLAALGTATLRRAAENLIDWFAIVVFSLFLLAAWAYSVAYATGTPAPMARSVLRLIPGYEAPLHWAAIALAVAVSASWIALAVWRLAVRPPMLWRGPLLAAGGLLSLWVMAMALALPMVDHVRSHAPLARAAGARLAAAHSANDCVATRFVSRGERAVFAYHGGLRFTPPAASADCRWLLQRDLARSALDDAQPGADWSLVWEGRWPARPDPTFRLYQRRGP